MENISRITISAKKGYPVRSLCWQGDSLVDWVSGGILYHLDGQNQGSSYYYSYRFDKAVSLAESSFAAIFEEYGTKGLILREGRIVRELNRSFYHANSYEYPIALFRLPD